MATLRLVIDNDRSPPRYAEEAAAAAARFEQSYDTFNKSVRDVGDTLAQTRALLARMPDPDR
jgi:hypothetical protein